MARISKLIKLIDHELYPEDIGMVQRVEVLLDDGTTDEVEMYYPEFPTGEDDEGGYHITGNGNKSYFWTWKENYFGKYKAPLYGVEDCDQYDFDKLVYCPPGYICEEIYNPETLEKISTKELGLKN